MKSFPTVVKSLPLHEHYYHILLVKPLLSLKESILREPTASERQSVRSLISSTKRNTPTLDTNGKRIHPNYDDETHSTTDHTYSIFKVMVIGQCHCYFSFLRTNTCLCPPMFILFIIIVITLIQSIS